MTESKYQKEISNLLVDTKAKALAIVIIGGEKGDCYEVRSTNDHIFRAMPDVLTALASKIKGDIKRKEEQTLGDA
jgi:hypothetical protein